MRRALIGGVLLFTGCVTSSAPLVALPARGQAAPQQAEDAKLCETQAQAKKDPAAWVGGFIAMAANEGAYQVAYKDCMMAKGYTFQE